MPKTYLLLALLLALGLGLPAQSYPDRFYYKFNEGSGAGVINFAIPSGGGTPAVPSWQNGGIANYLSVTGPGYTTPKSPQVGSDAIDFMGADYLNANGGIDLSTSFTVEAWLNTHYSSTSLSRLWASYYCGISLFRCYVGFYGNGVYHLTSGGELTGTGWPFNSPAASQSGITPIDEQWHHIALVYDAAGGTITSYIDGLVDFQATSAVSANNVSTCFTLGGTPGFTPTNVALDEFRWWDTARTQAQIQSTMFTEINPPSIRAWFAAAGATSGAAPFLVNFRDFSATPTPGGITMWEWDVDGDGIYDYINSTGADQCHIYPNSGTYDVSLRVTDSMGTHTQTLTAYINVAGTAYAVQTCGQGDIFLGAPTPPPAWTDCYNCISAETTGPAGYGWFFGIYPDAATWLSITLPGFAGSPFHSLNTANPTLFPYSTLYFPPGAVPGIQGTTLDAVLIYLNGADIVSWTNPTRVAF